MQSQSDVSASTPKTVTSGLGYPNNRLEVSAEPTGWLQNSFETTVNVSRETIG